MKVVRKKKWRTGKWGTELSIFSWQEMDIFQVVLKTTTPQTDETGAQHTLSKSQVSNTSLPGSFITENHSSVAQVPLLTSTYVPPCFFPLLKVAHNCCRAQTWSCGAMKIRNQAVGSQKKQENKDVFSHYIHRMRSLFFVSFCSFSRALGQALSDGAAHVDRWSD